MSQRTPKICQPRGKIVIPIEDGECLYWLIPVDTKEDIENPTRDFAWLDKRGVLYVFDGSKIVPINDPDLLKVKFENVMGSPYDNGQLGNELNKRVQTIKMNNSTVPMRTNGEVDLGCVTTCDDLERAIAGIETMHCEIVDELPEQGDEQTIYLMPIETEPEYIMPCHDFTFTMREENLYSTDSYITPTNAIPITNGKSYIVNIGGEEYEMTGVVSELGSGAKQYILSDSGITLSSLGDPNEDEYSFGISTDHVIDGATVIDEDMFDATVCVQNKKDTIFRMYIFVDGAYREVGSDKEIQTSCEKDWQENNPNSVKYIENRTHYVDESGVVHELDPKYIKSALGQLSDGRTSRETVTIDGLSAIDLQSRYYVSNADRKSINTAYIQDTSVIGNNVEVVFRGINSANTNYIDIHTTLKNYGSNPITIDVTWAVHVIEYAMIR